MLASTIGSMIFSSRKRVVMKSRRIKRDNIDKDGCEELENRSLSQAACFVFCLRTGSENNEGSRPPAQPPLPWWIRSFSFYRSSVLCLAIEMPEAQLVVSNCNC